MFANVLELAYTCAIFVSTFLSAVTTQKEPIFIEVFL